MHALAGYDAPYSLAGRGAVFDPGIFAALSVAGSLVSAGGSILSGNAQAENAKFQAQQLNMKATEERAAASREAADQARKQALVTSRQQALAAAGGGSATDPSILDLMGDTAAQGYVQRGTTVGLGENRARGYEDAAAVQRLNARNARMAGFIDAGSSLLSAPMAAYKAYGSAIPSASKSPYGEDELTMRDARRRRSL